MMCLGVSVSQGAYLIVCFVFRFFGGCGIFFPSLVFNDYCWYIGALLIFVNCILNLALFLNSVVFPLILLSFLSSSCIICSFLISQDICILFTGKLVL